MRQVKNFFSKFGILGELMHFLWQRKRWWLIPVVAVLVVLGILIIVAGTSAIAPFIYSLF